MDASHTKSPIRHLRYDLDSYDSHFALKPPALLIGVLLFLCRSYLMPFVMYAASVSHGAGDYGSLIYGVNPAAALIGAIPALLVFYALVRRVPAGGRFARWLWTRGRVLLVTSAFLETAPLVYAAAASNALDNLSAAEGAVQWLLTLLNVPVALYILRSGRVRDVFHDFPSTIEA
jgi:hypothetical protein